jgi:adenine-specific DNA-methyltransferase
MATKVPKSGTKKTVVTLTHEEATRKNIPTAEYQSVMDREQLNPIRVAYERRNRDLDPQLVWRGKDEQDWSDLVVPAPPLYIQEKVHPKAIIDDLLRRAPTTGTAAEQQIDLFADFNGLPNEAARTEFYQHDANWSNRVILGDSLQVMASLAEREGLRGQVQFIYLDPPYGIEFNSNFQWSTTSREVKDGNPEHITREPEQVKAFRDTWRDGIHSYLTYLRDRLTVARDLLADSGSIFVQINDKNLHLVRSVLDEVFGSHNFVQSIIIKKKSSAPITEPVNDFVLWAVKNRKLTKVRELYQKKSAFAEKSRFSKLELPDLTRIPIQAATAEQIAAPANRLVNDDYPMVSQDPQEGRSGPYRFRGVDKFPGKNRHWTLDPAFGMRRIERANRLRGTTNTVRGAVYMDDFGYEPLNNIWEFHGEREPVYVVQTNRAIIQRCILMTTDPSDLVLDPTCGSGSTAYVAEQWGRRWITIDTSRVALALARARIMSTRYPYYILSDSREGQLKEAEIKRVAPSDAPTHGNIRQGFVCERIPKIELSGIADNVEIDVTWERFQQRLELLREQLNLALGKTWHEWEIPREPEDPWDSATRELFYGLRAEEAQSEASDAGKVNDFLQALNHNLKRNYTLQILPPRPADPWPEPSQKLHAEWWKQRIGRQKEIDASIAAKAEYEYLYDRPYEDSKKVRVAGPFTVESLTPHRTLTVDENEELVDWQAKSGEAKDFAQVILENLKTAGVQQAHKEDKISFSSITPWPGSFVCAEGRYMETDKEKRAAIFIGPEFGTVSRPDLVEAAREAADGGFDALIACAFNYDAHCSEFNKLGRIPVLKARMNADLHMAEDLKNTGKGNLFVIFGEPDIDILPAANGRIQVKIKGVDVFHPNTGEVRSDGAEGIACWFIDTDYNEESFFVRMAYFLGANDPYKSLKTTLKAEINEEAWATLNSDISRPFDKPKSGRIAVKVINHLGDEVMKIFRVQ